MMFQPLNEIDPTPAPRPKTVEEVVDLLHNDLSLRDKVIMAQLSEDDLASTVYLAMAKIIRKEFGLYDGNTHLLDSCCSYLGGKYDRYEDPAMVIVKELWTKVKRSHNLRLIK